MKAHPLALVLLASLLTPLTAPAHADVLHDFALEYVIDMTSGEITYNVIGVYNVALVCSGPWDLEAFVAGAGDPLLATAASGGVQAAGPTEVVVRYAVSPSRGVLRVVEMEDGVRTGDFEYSCDSYTLDLTPSLRPTTGMVGGHLRAPADLADCATPQVHGTNHSSSRAPRGNHLSVPVASSHVGACMDFYYWGMGLAQQGCPTVDPCVPFSGVIRGNFSHKAADGAFRASIEGRACPFLVVGGYCWKLNSPFDGAPAPVHTQAPVWERPVCVCEVDFVTDILVSEEHTAVRAVGTWGNVVRLVG